MREGLEPELAVAVDVMYPMDCLARAATHSRKTYPHTPLRLYVEAMGGVIQPVLDRLCSIGIAGSLPIITDELQSEPLTELAFVTVVSPSHPLATRRGVVPTSALVKQVQLVLSDRSVLTKGRDFGVFVTADLAPGRSGRQTCIPQGWPGLGAYALAHGQGGSRRRHADQDSRRRRCARCAHADEGGLSQGCATRPGRPRLHRAAERVVNR